MVASCPLTLVLLAALALLVQVASAKHSRHAKQAATPSPTHNGGCKAFTYDLDTDYIGFDIGSATRSSVECCAKCASTSGCGAFTWTDFAGGTCWFKSFKARAVPKKGAFSGRRVPALKTFATCPAMENGVAYSGTVIGKEMGIRIPASCCSFCQNLAGCVAYTFNHENGGTCWLKSSRGSVSQASDSTSGVIQVSVCGVIEENVDYSGGDIANTAAKAAEDCCKLCHKNAACNAFSWSSHNGGTCWLKSGKGVAKTSQGVRSGVVTKSLPNNVRKHHKSHDHAKAHDKEEKIHVRIHVHHKDL